jgi:hypothetical protein
MISYNHSHCHFIEAVCLALNLAIQTSRVSFEINWLHISFHTRSYVRRKLNQINLGLIFYIGFELYLHGLLMITKSIHLRSIDLAVQIIS